MRQAVGFEVPKNAGSSLIVIVIQDPGKGVPVKWLQRFIRKNRCPIGQAPHGGRRRSDLLRRKHHHVCGMDAVGASR